MIENATRKNAFSPSPYGPLTIVIIVSCVLIFAWSLIKQEIKVPPKIQGVQEQLQLKGVTRALVYDYPAYFELRDEFLAHDDPKEERLFQTMQKTPFWNGFYDRFVTHFHHRDIPLAYSGAMFEKIEQKEVWRLFTPALLHFNFLHIFFNLLWFIVLGNQIEYRIKTVRYLILIVLIALISNTAQYLMSGAFFMGLSGVVCGLAAFIWAREQVAPWEGYLLNRFTLVFLLLYIFGIFALQVVAFIWQLYGSAGFQLPIANTAHIVGGLVGYLLGRFSRVSAIAGQ